MASRVRVSCINKTNRTSHYERISHIGGVTSDNARWKLTEDDAINAIEKGTYQFYVTQGGHTVDVIISKSSLGHKYLKTVSDGLSPDNLLSLPECP